MLLGCGLSDENTERNACARHACTIRIKSTMPISPLCSSTLQLDQLPDTLLLVVAVIVQLVILVGVEPAHGVFEADDELRPGLDTCRESLIKPLAQDLPCVLDRI